MSEREPGCTCHALFVGWDFAGFNLNESCPVHGRGTTYYVALMRKHGDRLRDLNERRRQAMNPAHPETEGREKR